MLYRRCLLFSVYSHPFIFCLFSLVCESCSYVTKNPFLLQSIGEHNCGLAGGIFLFKLVVWMHQKDLDSYVLLDRRIFMVSYNMMFSGFHVAWFICEALWEMYAGFSKNYIRKNWKKKQELLCRRWMVGDSEFCFYKATGIWVFLSVYLCGRLIGKVWFFVWFWTVFLLKSCG